MISNVRKPRCPELRQPESSGVGQRWELEHVLRKLPQAMKMRPTMLVFLALSLGHLAPRAQDAAVRPWEMCSITTAGGVVWASGRAGVYTSTDGGVSWQNNSSEDPSLGRSFGLGYDECGCTLFADDRRALIRYNERLFEVSRGSPSWRLVAKIPSGVRYIKYANWQSAWAICELRSVCRSEDTGATWQQVHSFVSVDFLAALTVRSKSNVWVLGSAGRVYHTVDSGRSWAMTQLAAAKSGALFQIEFTSEKRSWILGSDGFATIVYTSADAGETWTSARIPKLSGMNAMTVLNDVGWFVGIPQRVGIGTILHMAGQGEYWEPERVDLDETLIAAAALSATNALALGDHGTMLRTVDSGRTWQTVAYR
jgi:photosystem II stability/assembly factor-like uncharacterized protein